MQFCATLQERCNYATDDAEKICKDIGWIEGLELQEDLRLSGSVLLKEKEAERCHNISI